MGIVAINAVVLDLWSTTQIPVSIHATVSSVVIVFQLWPVTLAAKCHDVCEFNSGAIRKFQRVVVVGVMAGQTADGAVCKGHAVVEFVQVLDGLVVDVGRPGCVASGTSGRYRVAVSVAGSGEDSRRSGGLANLNFKPLWPWCGSPGFRSRRLLLVANVICEFGGRKRLVR